MKPQPPSPSRILVAVAAVVAFGQSPYTLADGNHKSPKSGTDHSEVEETTFGKAGDPKKANRTVHIEMSDRMRYTPAAITVKQGDTVKFVVKNNGKIKHEMVIGSIDELKAHSDMMKMYPGMEHDEAYMTHVPPGRTGNIVWHFTKSGEFNFGCLVQGHLEAGMVGKVTVLATAKKASK
jgi:uncharacterized cupredoxin-like copper-binding protein